MTSYTRKQVLELLELDDGFLYALEREDIIAVEADGSAIGEFSDIMLERARVAQTLVSELEVNLPGVSVIVRLREEIAGLRRHVEALRLELQREERNPTRS